jgi:hypothetical protein
MAGMFDDLIPQHGGPGDHKGMFDDLIPGGAAVAPLRDRLFEKPEDEALYQETLAEIKKSANAPRFPQAGNEPPDNSEDGMRRRARDIVMSRRGAEAEEKAFSESRTVSKRIGDAVAFAGDIPVRTLTGGKYGWSDIYDAAGAPEMASANRGRIADFARANESGLEWAKKIGDASLGIPALNGLGRVTGVSPALELRSAAALARAKAASVARGAVTDARLEDLAAFERSGVKPFGPAFTETGTAGTVKQLSEAPIVGTPVRNALGQALEETRDAGQRVAAQYGDAATYRDAGEVVRGAARRAVEETRDTAGSLPGTGTARSYRDAGNTARGGLERFSDARSADTIGDRAANLSDAQISNVAATPARNTSVRTKQDALYERAWRGIPEDMRRGRSRGDTTRFFGGLNNTRQLLLDLSERNRSLYAATRDGVEVDPRMSYPVRGGIAGRIVEDIIESRWRGQLQTMRDVRSNFRRLASGIGDTEANTLQLSDHRRIQSAMTQDMIGVLQRNAEHYRGTGDAATAARVERSIHDFRRADQFTRASAGRLEALEKLYGATSAESLAQNMLKDAQGAGKGNLDRLTALRRSLTDNEWGDVAGGILAEMGRPAANARGITQEAGYSVNNLIDNLSGLSPEGRRALFSHNPQLARELTALEQAARRGAAPLERRYSTKSPEEIGVAVAKDAEGGRKGGNFDRLQTLRRRLNDEEWGDIASSALREMGRPVGSARGQAQELGFSVQSAFTRYQNMSAEGRDLLFGREGARAQSLQDFIRVADRMANFEALVNTSRSATNGLGMAGLASIFTGATQLLMGNPGTALGAASVAGGMYGFGKFLTSPRYVRWLTRTVELSRDPRRALTLRDHARELARLAAKEADPAIQAVATALAQSATATANRIAQERGQGQRSRQTEAPAREALVQW